MAHQINSTAQRVTPAQVVTNLNLQPFSWGDESVAGFLANIRNLNGEPSAAEPRGWPLNYNGNRTQGDLTGKAGEPDAFTQKLTIALKELQGFNYDMTFTDNTNPAVVNADRVKTLRTLLGARFFRDIQAMEVLEADQVLITFTVV